MQRLDLKRELKHLYAPSAKEPALVEVPEFWFVQMDGAIEPGERPGTSPSFRQALEALYGVAYGLKFMSKQRAQDPIDYGVMPLEGLWWIDTGEFDFDRPDNWMWTLMIAQPGHITVDMFAAARDQLAAKKPSPAVAQLRFAPFHEGLSVQILHIGPYADEPATVAKLRAYATGHGYRLSGRHHEIYLGDPLRAAPEKLRTILRHPVSQA